jgi:prepilin-type N-terminal cleavage/methylation domain-containing protein
MDIVKSPIFDKETSIIESHNLNLINIRNENGFNLIELVVVISIIAILAGLVYPKIDGYKIRYYDAVAQKDLTNVWQTCQVYWVDTSPNNTCSLDVVISDTYRFASMENVALKIDLEDNSETAFKATASHANSPNMYTIDNKGFVSQTNVLESEKDTIIKPKDKDKSKAPKKPKDKDKSKANP